MNSRERFLAAERCQPVDHPPLYLRLWSMGGGEDDFPFDWRNQVARAEALLALGVDDTLLLEPPLGYTENYQADRVPGLKSAISWEATDPVHGAQPPILRKVYQTPAGPISLAIRRTRRVAAWGDIPLFSDFNVPRFVEAPVKSAEDLPRLRYLLASPSLAQLDEFWRGPRTLRAHADRLGCGARRRLERPRLLRCGCAAWNRC